MQPSILAGHRTEARTGEGFGIKLLSLTRAIPGLKRYRPVSAKTVAQAMINASFLEKEKVNAWTLNKIFELAQLH